MGNFVITTVRERWAYWTDSFYAPPGLGDCIDRQKSLFRSMALRRHEKMLLRLGEVVIQDLQSPLWKTYQPSYRSWRVGLLCLHDVPRRDRVMLKLKYG